MSIRKKWLTVRLRNSKRDSKKNSQSQKYLSHQSHEAIFINSSHASIYLYALTFRIFVYLQNFINGLFRNKTFHMRNLHNWFFIYFTIVLASSMLFNLSLWTIFKLPYWVLSHFWRIHEMEFNILLSIFFSDSFCLTSSEVYAPPHWFNLSPTYFFNIVDRYL